MSCFIKKVAPYGLLFLLIATILLMCATPPVSRDALTHHLAVPTLYVEHGGIYEIPDIEFSYYPELLDIIYCIPLMFKNDILPKYIHFLFALLTAFLIFYYIKNRLDSFWAILTVIFFLSLPVIVKLSTTVYVDLGLIFFSFASLLSLLKWRRDNFQLKWLTAAALFCGLALSTKYNGMITLLLLTAFVPFIYLSKWNRRICPSDLSMDRVPSSALSQMVHTISLHHQIKAIFYGLLFLSVSLAIFSPWMVKNYIWTQNPVYPLYDNFFNEPDNELGNDQTKKTTNTKSEKTFSWNHFLIRKYVYNETWWETALIPVRIFFQGKDDNPKYFDGKLNPLLFFLPFFAFIGQTSRTSTEEKFEKKVLLAFSFLYILTVFFQTDMRIRWIGPAIPPLIILSCFGFKNIYNMTNQKKTVTIFILSVFIFFLGQNLIYLYKQFNKTDPIPYITNKVTRSEYIQKQRPEYNTIQYANENLDKNTKILALFLGKRRYYFKKKVEFKKNLFKNIIKQCDDPLEAVNELKKNKYTDMIVNYSLFNNWINQNFTSNEIKIIAALFSQHTDKLFSQDGYGLYHLK